MENSDSIRGSTNLTLIMRDDDTNAETSTKLNLFGDAKDKAVRVLTACREQLIELGVITREDCKKNDGAKEGPGPRPGNDGQPG